MHAKKLSENVFVDPSCFKSIVTSAIEVYNRETNGCIIGKRTVRKAERRRVPVVSIKSSYPFQTAERKPSEVTHGNVAAFKRVLGSMHSLKVNVIGGYHSHPWPYEHLHLSKSDVEFIKEELGEMKGNGHRFQDTWLEILLNIRRKDYENPHKPGWSFQRLPSKVKCNIKTSRYAGFDVTASAYFVKFNGGSKPRISEGMLHIPWSG